MEKEDLIPRQRIGQQTDAEEEKIYSSPVDAKQRYFKAVACLLDVNNWHKISTIEASCFTLFDENRNPINRPVQQADYLRINIPGPGNSAGEGYDWVFIENMESFSDEESDIDHTLFVARPCAVPNSNDKTIAHFFTDKATSTFMVFRRANVISVEVHGRNELPNLQNQTMLDKARNVMVNGGSAVGFSFAQWHLIISGIFKTIA